MDEPRYENAYQRLAWSHGPEHQYVRAVEHAREELRRVVGSNEEHEIATRIFAEVEQALKDPGSVKDVSHHDLTKALVRRLRGAAALAMGNMVGEDFRRRIALCVDRPFDEKLVLRIHADATERIRHVFDQFDLPDDKGNWVAAVYLREDKLPDHYFIDAEGELHFAKGDTSDADLAVVAVRSPDGGPEVYAELSAFPAVASRPELWIDQLGPELEEVVDVEVVDEVELQRAVDGAAEDIDDALKAIG